jgi:DMSO/TMAO reductase YedYZ molybdopterin-dependent catalytic subunit
MRSIRSRRSPRSRSNPGAPSVIRVLIFATLILVTALTGMAGCGYGAPATAAATGSAPTTSAKVAGYPQPATALTVVGPSGTRTFTVADLQSMEAVTGQGGFTCPPTPGVTGPDEYTGVELSALLDEVGGLTDESIVSVAATDDYVMTYTADQIRNGTYVTYDPATGAEKQVDEQPKTIVAYAKAGSHLGDDEGPLRLAFLTSQPTQVVEGFLWVKWATRISMRDRNEDWLLKLIGAKDMVLDRAGFERLASTPGNEVSWEDIQGRDFTGVSLRTLARLVLQTDATGAAYMVEVVGADGAILTVDSVDLDAGDDYVVANAMEGNPLGDKEFPLSMVGTKAIGEKYLSNAKDFIQGIIEIRVTSK